MTRPIIFALQLLLLIVSSGVLSISYATSEVALHCKYQGTVLNCKKCSDKKQDNGLRDISLRINTDKPILTQNNIESISFFRSGDEVTWELSDNHPVNVTYWRYRLNTVTGNLVGAVNGKAYDCSQYWNTDSNCRADTEYSHYQCLKVEKLF
jgi:hypothetical protein